MLDQRRQHVALGGSLDHPLFQRGVQVAQSVLGDLAIVNVDRRTEPADDLAGARIAIRVRQIEEPAIFARGRPDAMLALVHALAVARRLERGNDMGCVLGMDERARNLGSGQRLERSAGVMGELPVEELHPALGIRDPDDLRHRVDHQPEPRLAFDQRHPGRDMAGRLGQHAENAAGLPILVDDGRVIQVHPHLFGRVVAIQGQLLILIAQRTARQPDPHHMVVEVGDLGPALAHPRSQQFGMPLARKDRIGIIIDHDAVRAP